MASKREIEAGRAFVRLFLKNDLRRQLSGAIKAAGAKLQSFGRGTMMAGAGMVAGGAALLAPLAMAVKSFAAQGDTLDKMAKRTGIAGSALAELSFAAEQSGTNLGTFEVGLRRMQRSLTDAKLGLKSATDGLNLAGLSVEQFEGLSPEEQFQKLADGIAGIEDPSKRAAASMMLFGRSGTMMLPMLENLRELRQEARDLGISPDEQDIENAAKVTDAINRVRRVIKQMFFDIGAGLAGPALGFLEIAKKIAMAVGKFAKRNAPLLISVAAIGTALVVAGTALTVFGAAIWGVGLALSALGSVVGMVLSPMGLLVATVVGGTVAWLKFTTSGQRAWGSLKAAVVPIINTLMSTFTGVKDALMSGDWEVAGKIAMTGLRLAVLQGLDAIRKAFPNTFASVLRAIGHIGDGIVTVWRKVTGFLTQQWNAWGKQTLGTAIEVIGRIPQMWQDAVQGMANWMLKTSAEGGVLGKIMSKILGVDMAEVQAERNRLNRALGQGPEDVLGESRQAVRDYMASLTAGGGGIAPGTGSISESLESLLRRLESGEAIGDLAAELAALRKEAAEQRGTATTGAAAGPAGGGLGVALAAPRGVALTATYSAAAARIAGYQPGGGPEKKMADGIVAIERHTAEMTRQQQEFLAGWRTA